MGLLHSKRRLTAWWSRRISTTTAADDDDLTGQPLSPELCRNARATEIDDFRDKKVWTIRKVNEALRRTGKPPINVRWVEVNKGDDINCKIRSRLVAREFRLKGEEAIFAPTPPLESLRMLVCQATT